MQHYNLFKTRGFRLEFAKMTMFDSGAQSRRPYCYASHSGCIILTQPYTDSSSSSSSLSFHIFRFIRVTLSNLNASLLSICYLRTYTRDCIQSSGKRINVTAQAFSFLHPISTYGHTNYRTRKTV